MSQRPAPYQGNAYPRGHGMEDGIAGQSPSGSMWWSGPGHSEKDRDQMFVELLEEGRRNNSFPRFRDSGSFNLLVGTLLVLVFMIALEWVL